MLRQSLATLVVMVGLLQAAAQEPHKEPLSAAAEKYQSLVQQFKEKGRSPQLVEGFQQLAQQHPDDPAAIDALAWLVIHVRDSEQAKSAVQTLLDNYGDHERIASILPELTKSPSLAGEGLMRGLLDKSGNSVVQASACFYLAEHLREQLRLRESLADQPTAKRRFEQFYGKEFTARLLEREPEATAQEAEEFYDRVANQFADVRGDLREQARVQLNELRFLATGKLARDIEGEDIDGQPFKLSDYRGKVVMLSFWGHW